MPPLPEQASSGQRRLPALRESLKKLRVWLALTLLLVVTLMVDLRRDPAHQVGARLYVMAVRGYQAIVSPRISGFVRCRYFPSCSEYSVQAVDRYGLARGIELTAARLCRCRSHVPLGTWDPVPGQRSVQTATGSGSEQVEALAGLANAERGEQ